MLLGRDGALLLAHSLLPTQPPRENCLKKWLEQYLKREVGEYTEDEMGLKKSFVTVWRAAQPDPPILFRRFLEEVEFAEFTALLGCFG